MIGRLLRRALGAAPFLAVLFAVPVLAVPVVPSQFVVEDVAPGAAFNTPVNVAFFPGGRMLVAEKRGRVYTVVNGVKSANPLWQSENEILNNGDRGLLSVAVDPRYNGTTNRWIYLLYTVDPDSNGTDTDDDAFGRLVRVQVSATDSTVADYTTRQVLFGTSWRQGPLSASTSHTIGSLRFARDGSLIVSVGDGAQFNSMDQGGQDPGAFGATKTDPYEDITRSALNTWLALRQDPPAQSRHRAGLPEQSLLGRQRPSIPARQRAHRCSLASRCGPKRSSSTR